MHDVIRGCGPRGHDRGDNLVWARVRAKLSQAERDTSGLIDFCTTTSDIDTSRGSRAPQSRVNRAAAVLNHFE